MASRSNCTDIQAHDQDTFRSDGVYSPPSSYSTYSQEIKFIFEPEYGDEDYSQINTSNRKQPPKMPRTSSSSSSHVSDKSGMLHSHHHFQNHNRSYPDTSTLSPHYREHSRQNIWTPPTITLGAANGLTGSVHSCQSSEQLDKNLSNGHLNGDVEEELLPCPPKLTPVSGILARNLSQGLIRPIAFKPVLSKKYASTPRHHSDRRHSSQDEGYGSQDYQVASHNASNTSHGVIHVECDKSTSFSSDCINSSDRPGSLPSSSISRISSSQMESFVQTPSPSDSGVGELEALLREKDAELNALRDVMDKNERAIFQVYEEKKSAWINEIRDMRDEFDRRIKNQQRKAYKAEQVLSLQVYKLQQENKKLKEENDKTCYEKDSYAKMCDSYREEINQLKSQLDQVHVKIQRKSDDIDQLRHQISDLTNKLSHKSTEVLALQAKVEDNESEIDEKNQEIHEKFREIVAKSHEVKVLKSDVHRLSSCSLNTSFRDIGLQTDLPFIMSTNSLTRSSVANEKDLRITALTDEINNLSQQVQEHELLFEKEKEKWLDEKGKVIRYQKQLQLNYVQMYRKNRTLEAEVEQLTIELESRDLKLLALNGEESVC